MILLYPFMAIGSLATTLISILFFNWWVVLFADANGNLPNCLSYFQTFDAPIPKGYLNGVKWLMRNPAYGFDYYVFGLRWNPSDWTIERFEADENRVLFLATNKNGGFNFYYLGKYGMYKFGWKVWNDFTGTKLNSRFGDGSHIPICFSVNPFKHS